MGVTNFSIVLDNPLVTFYPGQVLSGKVIVCVDKPKKIRGIEIKFKGKAKVRWTETETYRDSEGKSHDRSVAYTSSEQYFRNEYNLVGKGQEFELTIGEHVYNFNHTLSHGLPSSYNGEFGGISYYIKAKMDIPWSIDKKIRSVFPVHSPYDLNTRPQLKDPMTDEDDKTFCCLCCASGPLVIKAYLPKTGFAFGANIPLTVEINNTSNVAISKVTCSLIQVIKWIARNPRYDSKSRKNKMVTIELGDASPNSNRTWNENLTVPETVLPNLSQCGVIDMLYYVKVTADPEGAHSDLDVEIPIELGDIPLYDSEYNPSTAPVYPNIPSAGVYPQSGSSQYPPYSDSQNPSIGQPPYPSSGQPQYPISGQPQYPDSGQPQYPNVGQPPYPGTGQPAHPGTGQPPYSGTVQPAYPGTGQPPYPGTGQPPYPGTGQPPYPGTEQPPYTGTGQPAYPGAGQPPYPGTGQPAYPGAGQPPGSEQQYPSVGQPQYPSSGQPQYPSSGQPQYAGFGQPQYPGAVHLSYSGAGAQSSYSNSIQTPYPGAEQGGVLRSSNNAENIITNNEKDPISSPTAPSAPEAT